MKIAILLAGHLRFWEYECKDNFMKCLYQDGHDIDVFVDTYNSIFRSDYLVRRENEKVKIVCSDKIHKLFDGINVVSCVIEPELVGGEAMQVRKLLNVYDAYVNYEKSHGEYDLVIKSRFDIKLHAPLDYSKLKQECTSQNKILHISHGAVVCRQNENDMFCIGDTHTFKIYGNRHRNVAIQCVHSSIGVIQEVNGIKCIPDIGISILRFSHDGSTIITEN